MIKLIIDFDRQREWRREENNTKQHQQQQQQIDRADNTCTYNKMKILPLSCHWPQMNIRNEEMKETMDGFHSQRNNVMFFSSSFSFFLFSTAWLKGVWAQTYARTHVTLQCQSIHFGDPNEIYP